MWPEKKCSVWKIAAHMYVFLPISPLGYREIFCAALFQSTRIINDSVAEIAKNLSEWMKCIVISQGLVVKICVNGAKEENGIAFSGQ